MCNNLKVLHGHLAAQQLLQVSSLQVSFPQFAESAADVREFMSAGEGEHVDGERGILKVSASLKTHTPSSL